MNELASLEIQYIDLGLEDKQGKPNFQENLKKVFELVTKSFKDVSEDITKIMMVTSEESSKAIRDLNEKLSEIMIDSGISAA